MNHLKRITRTLGPWRGKILVALVSLAVLLILGFLFLQAIGGIQQLAVLIDQLKAQLLALGEPVRDWVAQTGPWAPLTYLFSKALIFIFIPVAGYPLNVASGALFGLVLGVLLTALGDTLGACILFLLSRWAGRRTVQRIIGEERMGRVDTVLDRGLGGWRELLFFRVVVPIPFNFVSLAAGLAYKLPLRHFAAVTFITASPKIFTVGLGAGFVAGEWLEVAVASGLFVVAVAALLTRRWVRKAIGRALRWRRDEQNLAEDG